MSGILTTALYLGGIRTGTNAGQADGWTDRQLGNWEREARDKSRQGKNNKRKNNNLAGNKLHSKRQIRASDNYKGT